MPVKTQIAQKIIDEITDYVSKKENLDSLINLSKGSEEKTCLSVDKVENNEGYMTLLSEGAVLYGDGTIRLFIAKGTLADFYNSLDETYEGYVTTAHISTDAHPVRQGYFRKANLKLITDENGRSDLLVKPVVNTNLSTIKDILIQDEPFAISSEFMWSDMEEPDIEEYAKLVVYNVEHGGDVYVPITNRLHITGFSFVGNPGNAKSGGYEPSLLLRNEEEQLLKKEILDKVLEQLNKEQVEVEKAEALEDKKDSNVEVEVEEKLDKDVVEEAKDDKVAELLEKATERIEQLEKDLAELKEKNEKLEKENTDYKEEEASVSDSLTKLEALLTKTNLSVEQPVQEKKEEQVNVFGRARFGGK